MSAFRALEQRVGAAMIARLANARAVFDAAPDAAAACIFNRTAVQAGMGGVAMAAREVNITCATAALPAGTSEGDALQVFEGEQLVVAAGAYVVARGGRTDSLETGTTTLQLEAAP